MSIFNNFGDYNVKEEAAKRIANIEALQQEKPTAKIEHYKGFKCTTCPECGKTKILSSELNTMSAVCNICYCAFKLI